MTYTAPAHARDCRYTSGERVRPDLIRCSLCGTLNHEQQQHEAHGHTIVCGNGDRGMYAFVLGHVGGGTFTRSHAGMPGIIAQAERQARECTEAGEGSSKRNLLHTGWANGNPQRVGPRQWAK